MLLDVLVASSSEVVDDQEEKIKQMCMRIEKAAQRGLEREKELVAKLEELDVALFDMKQRYQQLSQEYQKLKSQNFTLLQECNEISKGMEQPMIELGTILGKQHGTSGS